MTHSEFALRRARLFRVRPSAPATLRAGVLLGAALTLAACGDGPMDWDLRQRGDGFSTRDAAREAVGERPAADSRGVISYPGYQVAVAQRGDTVATLAARVGLPAAEIASFNAIDPGTVLRNGEIIALPRRVPESGAGPIQPPGGIDITELASGAIDRAEGEGPRVIGGTGNNTGSAAGVAPQTGPEPVRHQVVRGETAFSIARLYNVSTRSLADWNGLGSDMVVREGQFLLIPVAETTGNERAPAPEAAAAPAPAAPPATSAPGQGSPTPEPPSAARPLPEATPAPAAAPAPEAPPSPNLAAERTPAAGSSQLAMPVQGRVIRPYARGTNEGIGIAASAGTTVRAAADGVVAAITRDTGQVPILVIRHESLDLMTVYVNLDNISVERGARVSRGASIGAVAAGDPAFLHFEVRRGFESVDPMPFLQ